MIVVEFPSKKVFQEFLEEAENQNIHRLRESSTKIIYGLCTNLGT